MIYLIGSILLTSYLTLSFKVLGRLNIPVFPSIVFNYLTCVVTGSVVNGAFPINASSINEPWLPWACLMGAMFIVLFNIIGLTTQKLGVAVASVANKLSLVIPFIFSIYLYGEKAGWVRVAGILVALVAVVFTCMPRAKEKSEQTGNKKAVLLLPLVLFLGSGLLDTLVKWVEQEFLNEGNNNAYLIASFGTAGLLGSVILVVLLVSGKAKFDIRTLIAGIAIGIPNYFSIWCLVRVLKQYEGNSSAIIPINNMGIVLFSSLVAWLAFREKLTVMNWLGIVLSIGAIALIAFG